MDYNHAALGPLTAKVNRLSLDEIKKGVIDESEIYNSVRFESYGVDTSMTSILGSVQEYRNNIKKQKTLEDRVEVMGYDSLKDYLICVCK